ncbi:hypothetical protein ACJIZ3_011879 [Penstemon smallii]|uniref:F-box/LRR-repeat protein 15/At3g58940/PEG3-like LRR domain-containing protein n=1 Tax=Penstemon smallii TaxID=265156 RepID=A0ABD3UNX3_9LAMI
MEEGKFEILPEEVMHHIQSFISSRKAAKTCLLSKSWYTAWCTHPILSFDERDFRTIGGFANFTRKTIQRYRESNLNVPTFRLRFNKIPEICPITSYLSALLSTNRKINESTYLANELILDALKLGVNDLKFEIDASISSYVLPVQVFAATTNLRKLVVSACTIAIDHWPMINNTLGGVTSSCLTSLSLLDVSIGEDTMTSILLGCPLIEDFNVHDCKGFSKINVSMMQYNLKKFRVERLLFCESTLSLSIEIEEPILGPVSNGQISVPKYRNLSSLTLKYVTIDNKFFHNFSHKFPCLENLTINRCSGYEDVEIGGPSLKCISFTHVWKLDKAEFDVPSIQKFEFSVVNPPSMSFTTSSREWESYISLSGNVDDVSWFNKLRKFLAELSQSRISLNVNISIINEFAYVQYNQGFHIAVVENLMLGVKPESTMCSALLNNLLCSCHPKFITLSGDSHPKFITLSGDNNLEERNKKMLGLLIRSEFRQTNPDYLNPAENLLCNLEKVNVEFFDRTLMQWQSFPPWELFFVYSKIAKGREKIRFRLRWGHFSN